MCRFLIHPWRILIVTGCAFALAACEQPKPTVVHRVTTGPDGNRLECQLCYDETIRMLTGPPKHKRYKTILRHRCECRTDVTFYVGDDGKLMMRCSRCAPEGMPCDGCLPPAPARTPSGSP